MRAKQKERRSSIVYRTESEDRQRTKPEAGGEISSVPSPLSLVHALVPMACGLKLVPALVPVAFELNPLVNRPGRAGPAGFSGRPAGYSWRSKA